MRRREVLKSGAALGGVVLVSGFAQGRSDGAGDALFDAFRNPSAEARPRVWWHWVNGNVSKDGVMADLAWMKRVGVGGFTLFDAAFRSPPTPVVVDRPLIFHSPEWREVVGVTAAEAARLDLDFGVHIAGGWSESGGPWVRPDQAMKKLVWSESVLEGGAPLTSPLPAPPDASGPYLDYPIAADLAEPRFYRDVAVVAFPEPETRARPAVEARTNAGSIDIDALEVGRLVEAQAFSPSGDEPLIITLDYAQAWLAASLTLSSSPAALNGKVEVSEDGVTFRTLVKLPGPAEKGAPVRTYGFAPVRARSLRLILDRPASGRIDLRQLAVRSESRVHRVEDKSGLGTLSDYEAVATLAAADGSAIPVADVIDLTARLRPDGHLDWTPPAGRWVVQRFGYALTGKRNVPATPAATGLEADKLNADHVRAHLDGFFGPLIEAVGENYGRRGLRHAIVDSWEAGQQNWTEAMLEAFAAKRGYDLTPYLPVMTGRIVQDAAVSDRVLWDFRATIGDLLAENHYAVIRDYLHARGLYLYGESMGVDLPTVGDGLRLKGLSDVPTGEFWAQVDNAPDWPTHVADIREAASAAHIYGRKLVAAEAFTALDQIPAWSMGPRELKPVADRFLAEGVNRFVIHTSVHQPFLDRAPGVTLRRYGQHFTRHEAWAEQADLWLDYLSRGCALQQQGRPVADIAVFYGDGAPVAAPFRPGLIPEIPAGYDYDYVNAEVLERARMSRAGLTLESGATYRLLALAPGVRRLSPATLQTLERLVREGLILVGDRPKGAAGRLDAREARGFEVRLARLWGRGVSSVRVGRGQVLAKGLNDALAQTGTPPDLAVDTPVHWSHRRTDDADIYYLANPFLGRMVTDARFRVTERTPEIWSALDGGRRRPVWQAKGEGISVRLDLKPGEAIFVVFRSERTPGLPPREERLIAAGGIAGPWRVTFQPGRGVDRATVFEDLVSWTERPEAGIRWFSGVATYATTVTVPPTGEGEWVIDLGAVGEMAVVRVNGQTVGGAWTAPYRIDLGASLRPGPNRLEVEVANYWHNRLVGDLQSGARPVGFVTVAYYEPGTPLRESGLVGPVTLWRRAPAFDGGNP